MSADDRVYATDGLVARDNGPWAKDKLSFLDQFVPAALQATTKKSHRWYVDLFAGPGVNVDRDRRGNEFVGSALRALPMRSPADPDVHFTDAVLVNLEIEDHQALQERVRTRLFNPQRCALTWERIRFLNDDANQIVNRVMAGIDRQAYAFVFADIENPSQLPFETVSALKAHGHLSVDLYVLFPLEMAIRRMLSYNRDAVEANARALTRFFGTAAWRDLVSQRITDAQSPELSRRVIGLYQSQLQHLGWKEVLVVRDVKRRGEAGLYKMLYASNHPAGGNIAKWAANRERTREQFDLGLD